MSEFDKNLESYIKRILEIQQSSQNKAITSDELKGIAKSMGLSDQEWKLIDQTYHDHLKRGLSYVRHKNWDDALEEFMQALTLRPNDPDLLFKIADAHKNRFFATRNRSDRQKALAYARQCMKIYAGHQGAPRLISELKKQSVPASAKGGPRVALLLGSFIMVFVIGVSVFIMNYSSEKQPSRPVIIETPQPIISKPETESKKNTNKTSPTTPQTGDGYIPVELIKDANTSGLDFSLAQSQLKEYTYGNGSYNYRLGASFKVNELLIKSLKLKIEFLDGNGQVMHTDFIDAKKERDPVARNNDYISISYSQYKQDAQAPDWKSARLSVALIQKFADANASNYKDPEVLTEWGVQQPVGYDLQIYKREEKYTQAYRANDTFHKVAFFIVNKGKLPIEKLKVELQWFNQQNQLINSKAAYPLTAGYASLQPKENRIYQGTWKIEGHAPSQIALLKVVITDIN